MKRREFLTRALGGAAAAFFTGSVLKDGRARGEDFLFRDGAALPGFNEEPGKPVEARYYKKEPDLRVQCELCPRKCTAADRERGYCGVRENRGGTYYTLVYGTPCSVYADPIEKKPLFHYLPGTNAFSIATAGCNIECKFCQNWDISQFRPEQVKSYRMPPEGVVRYARKSQCATIAYTYSEPVIFYEYMYDTAVRARKSGIGNVIISNGYINKEPLRDLCEQLTAAKIDLKAFTETFYRETCHGELKPVLETLVELKKTGIWFEIVVLLVPTLNDSEKEIKAMCTWIKETLGNEVPVHFSRFHPTYKLKNLPRTPVKTLETARAIGLAAGLRYVYLGNVPGHEGENTYCPQCGKPVIRRVGFTIVQNLLKEGTCPGCGHAVPGIWKDPLMRG